MDTRMDEAIRSCDHALVKKIYNTKEHEDYAYIYKHTLSDRIETPMALSRILIWLCKKKFINVKKSNLWGVALKYFNKELISMCIENKWYYMPVNYDIYIYDRITYDDLSVLMQLGYDDIIGLSWILGGPLAFESIGNDDMIRLVFNTGAIKGHEEEFSLNIHICEADELESVREYYLYLVKHGIMRADLLWLIVSNLSLYDTDIVRQILIDPKNYKYKNTLMKEVKEDRFLHGNKEDQEKIVTLIAECMPSITKAISIRGLAPL